MRYAISTKDERGEIRTFVIEPLRCHGNMLVALRNGIEERFVLDDISDWYPIEDMPANEIGLPVTGDLMEKSVFDLCF